MRLSNPFKFSKNELRDLTISVLVVSVIFSYPPAIAPFHISLLIVITAFLFHELAHRFVARKFGCAAVYKIWLEGMIFGLLLMLVGVKFVAPGVVMIAPYMFGRWGFRSRHLSLTEMGLIGLSGPGTNLALALAFRPLSGMWMVNGTDVFFSLYLINAWIALVNLLPIKPLDGQKIFGWKPWFWFLMFIAAMLLLLPPGILSILSIG